MENKITVALTLRQLTDCIHALLDSRSLRRNLADMWKDVAGSRTDEPDHTIAEDYARKQDEIVDRYDTLIDLLNEANFNN